MSKKILKLALALGMLVGGMNLSARDVSAAAYCSDICCDASCTSIRQCFRFGGGCICQEFCEPVWGGID